ncbi:flagellar export chaperone FliS [Methylocaldum sp.]|uniref:flagellar export chaperone FliS n=1 Tax=Methylocaldum sp. TaxID=1969727 RepID=UPI002D6B0EBB|nr:flagellar export chaperone FliS [Methylocaldum sp.]HYE35216.1 flagellar export chaperone FliS [Methylocaldum sp.]
MRPAQFALNQYRQTNVQASVEYADPHALVIMLFNGLNEKIAIAKGSLQRGALAEKGQAISRAIGIVGYLQACLDLEKGGEIAANLDRLYTYITERLFHASAKNDQSALDEIGGLVKDIKSAWEAIRDTVPNSVESRPAAASR